MSSLVYMKRLQYILLACMLIASACKSQPSVTTGVSGKVIWLEGNQMPGPGQPESTGEPVERTILICSPIKVDEAQGAAPLFTSIPKRIIKSVESNTAGEFSTELAPGTYSIIVKEGDGYFANSFDGNNVLNPVKVSNSEVSEILIRIDYKAAY